MAIDEETKETNENIEALSSEEEKYISKDSQPAFSKGLYLSLIHI